MTVGLEGTSFEEFDKINLKFEKKEINFSKKLNVILMTRDHGTTTRRRLDST